MNKSVLAAVLVGLCAFSATANEITIYFGRPEYVTTQTTSFVADSANPGGLSLGYGTFTLGIWANVGATYGGSYPVMDIWNNIALNIVGDDSALVVTDLIFDNFDHKIGPGTAYRWENDVDPEPFDNSVYVYALTTHGLGGLYTPEWDAGSGLTDWWSYSDGDPLVEGTKFRYWLGNVTLAYDGPGEVDVFFQIGTGGVGRLFGDPSDLIYFGEDEPVPLHGDDYLQISSLPDVRLGVPEPAGLLLAAGVILTIRRR
jgi:hypothetical protein